MGDLGGRQLTHPKLKQALGRLPAAAEAYQALLADGRQPEGGYALDRLEAALPAWVQAGVKAKNGRPQLLDRKVLVLGYLPWWLEYAAALATLFASLGCKVGLGYIPYRRWTEQVQAFDRRRQSAYIRGVLASATVLFDLHDLSIPSRSQLVPELAIKLEALSRSDVQYTLQREDVEDPLSGELFQLRMERNSAAAMATMALVDGDDYEVVVIPNGSILEFGAAYLAARYRGATVVTYEFGEQRERMWLAQNGEVMRQDTAALWKVRGRTELTGSERSELESMFSARRSGKPWGQFARRWQSTPGQGAQEVAERVGLELSQPIALLCTNVVADSLALNRQLFTSGMAEWLTVTARHFESLDAGQLVVRVHPGEMLGAGHPSTEIVRSALPDLPSHVKLVGPDSDINTYDLIELADLGLVYTSTVGLEMAMVGIPVIVAGDTHYRGKGFTTDPGSVDDYLAAVDRALGSDEARLGEDARELAVRYAHRFFFEYPFPFPWHLIGFWEDVEARPVEQVIAAPGAYLNTMLALLGEPIDWAKVHG